MLMLREVAADVATLPECALEALAAGVTPAAVEAVLTACGVREQRQRNLPAAVPSCFCLAMQLLLSGDARVRDHRLGPGLRPRGEWVALAVAPPRRLARQPGGAVPRPRAARRPPARARWGRWSSRSAARWRRRARTARRAPSWAGGA
jgi:hypothetical protein